MSWHHKGGNLTGTSSLHQFYMNIINTVPDSVYWVDVDCNLMGCNNNFVALLGLNELRDFNGTPYEQMTRFARWPKARVESLKLDDMNVIFSGVPRYNIDEKPIFDDIKERLYLKSTRVPMFDENKNIVGLIVVLTDVTQMKHLEAAVKSTDKRKPKTRKSTKTTQLPNVLMIEDNLIAQNVEKALLTALNCQVDIAETGDQALALFGPGKYDLVLMDIGLEGTSGYVVAKQLRRLEQDTKFHVPIIALTGYEADVVKYDCEQYFMEGAITKPLTSEQAEQIINHYVYHIDTPVRGLKSTQ
ncbi:MAG: response regulator [Legionella sp.]|nr:response regulator [Legionella sp.]